MRRAIYLVIALLTLILYVAHTSRADGQADNPLANPNQPAPPAANPLAAPADAAQPAAPADANAAGVPANYIVVASIGSGHALFAQKTDAKTLQSAMTTTLRDLAPVFDAKPKASGAFADAKENRQGGASFTAALKGQPYKGYIICGIGDQGAAVTVVYDEADAPQSEWAALAASLPQNVKWVDHPFPDGSGTVRLPDDWKLDSTTPLGAAKASGPGDQHVDLGDGGEVLTPDNWIVQNSLRMQQQARMMGTQPPPPIKMLVAPYTDPVTALKNIIPQISAISVQNGGPALKLRRIIATRPVQVSTPNAQGQRIYFSFLKVTGNNVEHCKSIGQMVVYPLGQGSWGFFYGSLEGPDATFGHDLPIMMEIAQSWKLNDQVVEAHTQQQIAAQNRWFNSFEAAQKEKQDAFDQFEADTQHNQLIEARSNDNFDEIIRGYRTVEDTETGDKTSVDLGNVDQVVNSLNAGDPGRYIQIPLRDEADPLPGTPQQ
jgi:hypothetical protein